MKVERDNPETTKPTLESELAPGTVCHFPKEDTTTLFMRTDGSGEAACAVLADESGYFEPGELYQVDDVPVVVVDAALRVRG